MPQADPNRRRPKPAAKADPIKRAGRSGVQASIVTLLLQGYNLFFDPDLTFEQTGWLTVVGYMLVSFIQNALEEDGILPRLWKDATAPPVDAAFTPAEIAALKAALASRTESVGRAT